MLPSCRNTRYFLELNQKWSMLNRYRQSTFVIPNFSSKGENYKKEPFSTVVNRKRYHSSVAMLDLINSVKTAPNLLSVFENCDSIENDQIVKLLYALDNLLYESVKRRYPWAESTDRTMLCVKSFISKDCHKFFLDVIETGSFERLTRCLLKNCATLTDEELVAVTSSLIRLHVEPSSEIMTSLITRCLERCPFFEFSNLCSLMDVTSHLMRSGFYLTSEILQNVDKNFDQLTPTLQNYKNVAQLMANSAYFCSSAFICKAVSKFVCNQHLSFSDGDANDVDPQSAISLLIALGRFARLEIPSLSNDLALVLVSHLKTKFEALTLENMEKIVFHMQLFKFKNHVLTEMIKNRTTALIDKADLTPSNIVCLISIFDKIGYSKITLFKLENLFMENVAKFDSILLKDISRQKFLLLTKNDQVVKLFCDQIIQTLPDLDNSLGCIMSIVYLLNKLEKTPANLNRNLSKFLMEKLQSSQIGLESKHLATICRFLLQSVPNSGSISTFLVETVLAMTPRFSIQGLLDINAGITKLKTNFDRPRGTETISRHITNTLIQKIPDAQHIDFLNKILKSCIVFNIHRENPDTFKLVAELYSNFSNQVDVQRVRDTCANVAELKLHVPQLLDSLANCVVNNKRGEVDLQTVSEVIRVLAVVNYVPARLDDLTETFLELQNRDDQKLNNINNVVATTCALSILGVYPEGLLPQIFSIGFLQKFDVFCKELKTSRKQTLQRHLLNLNRSAILQCPHLTVPWFHADFVSCQKQSTKSKFSTWKDEVKDILLQIVEPEFLIADENAVSDYGHRYDFGLYLDQKNNPVPISSQINNLTKVAILVSRPSHYCTNVRHLLGYTAAKLQQLEILEYKVVIVPYYELDSMEFTSSSALQHYLEHKIFYS